MGLTAAEIFSFNDKMIMVQKFQDFYVFLMADGNENELVILDLLGTIADCLIKIKPKGE